MFVLTKSDSYLWPVKTEIPKDGGTFHKETFEIQFKRITEARKKQVFGSPAGEGEVKSDVDFCKEVVVGWKDVKDSDGQEVPFSQSNLDSLLAIPKVASFIVEAFLESMAGSRVKN